MAKKITFRIWVLIIAVALSIISIFSIPPMILENGVLVSSVDQNSTLFELGLRQDMVIKSINGEKIEDINDYNLIMGSLAYLEENETERLEIIASQKVGSSKQVEIIGLFGGEIIDQLSVEEIPPTRIKTGLDLRGGARALVKADVPLNDAQLDDLIAVSEQRLNAYGLSDVQFSKVTTSSGEKLMSIEIAGSSPDELEELITQQGKFEAKIGNKTVFTGGDEDITHIGKYGEDAQITDCSTYQDGSGDYCNFRFSIFLSTNAAEKMAEVTDDLQINGTYLSEQIDFYIDNTLTDSLNIGSDLKGRVVTQVSISGSGEGNTRNEAIEDTRLEMKKLQTILITGSLPYELEIASIDKISPNLNEQFTRQIIIAGLFAILAVSLIVFIRYKKLKVSLALIAVSLSEVIIILGVAALIGWNLNLVSVAGIIAAIGTGIDSQLIILDEARDKHESITKRIKKALFIIATAFATTAAAMLPLTDMLSFMGIGAASAGLLKGFAVTTLIGITTGVLISRPAFADIARNLQD